MIHSTTTHPTTHLTISAVYFSQSVAYRPLNDQVVSLTCVNIELSDGSIFKGDAALNSSDGLDIGDPNAIKDGLNQMLVGQPADNFPALCQLVDQGHFTTDQWRYPEPVTETPEIQLKKNRRDILSALGVVKPRQLEKVLTPVESRFPNIIIRGITAALLRAVAYTASKSIQELIQSELETTTATTKDLKLGLDVSFANHQPFLSHVSALCYTVPAASDAQGLGKTGEKFQKYLRDLNSWIADSWAKHDRADRPWLFVDLNGAIHRLNNQATGKTLGSLFGFSTTGNQEKMIFANPVENTTPLKTVNDMTLLQSLVKSRKLKIKLAAASNTHTSENVALWLDKCKPEIIVLKEAETANLGDLLDIIKQIMAHGTLFILVGGQSGNPRSWGLIHEIAASADPEFYIPAGGKHGFLDVVNR
ncbi:MAG: hypothetical protein ACI9EW_000633 [Cellvibrionaceae bacterium]|jgi:hypothetical protein